MLTLEQCRQIDPELNKISDEELIKIRAALYELGEIIFDDWITERADSKYPTKVLQNPQEGRKI